MYLEQSLLVKHNGKVKEGKITKIWKEDLEIELKDGTIIQRKFWEVRKMEIRNDQKI